MQRKPGDERDDGHDEAPEDTDRVPSFLTARELQALDPAKPQADASAKDEPLDEDDEDEKPAGGAKPPKGDGERRAGAERRR